MRKRKISLVVAAKCLALAIVILSVLPECSCSRIKIHLNTATGITGISGLSDETKSDEKLNLHQQQQQYEETDTCTRANASTINSIDLDLEESFWNASLPFLQYINNATSVNWRAQAEEMKNEEDDDDFKDFSFINFTTQSKYPFKFQPIDEVRLRTRAECTFDPSDNFHHTAVDLLKIEGHTVELHYITSKDGYIVQYQRLAAPGKPPVLLMPGIFQSSRDYLINCKGRTLGNMLFKNGFDVWFGNYRGGVYGRNHTHLDPDTKEFWDYAGDDMAKNDATAAVDYILGLTGYEKINYVGYSLGSTVLYGLLAGRPEYNKKFNVAITLAPAVYFGKTKTLIIKNAAPFRRPMESYMLTSNHGEAIPMSMVKFMHKMSPKFCIEEALTGVPGVCSAFLQTIDGVDHEQMNFPRLPLLAGGFPSPTSIRVISQWFQWILRPEFTKYDYGAPKNMYYYGSIRPPTYDLTKVTAPTIIFWSENDYITDKRDVFRLVEQLPNLEAVVRVNWKKWTHIDYVYGKDADILVYEPVINILKYKTNPLVMAHAVTPS